MSTFTDWVNRVPNYQLKVWQLHVQELLGRRLIGDWFRADWHILELMYNAHLEGIMYFPEVVRLLPGQNHTDIKLTTNWSKFVFCVLSELQKPLNDAAQQYHPINQWYTFKLPDNRVVGVQCPFGSDKAKDMLQDTLGDYGWITPDFSWGASSSSTHLIYGGVQELVEVQ